MPHRPHLLAALLLGILPAALPAQDFDERVAAADELAAQESFKEALDTLRRTLAHEEYREQILRDYPAILQRLSDWTFLAKTGDLSAQDLLVGTISSFKEKKRSLRIVWDWTNLNAEQRNQDFLKVKEDWLFAVPVQGNVKFTLEGNFEGTDPISIVAGFDLKKKSGWRFSPGFKRTTPTPVITMPLQCKRIGKPFENFFHSSDKLEEPEGEWAYTLEIKKDKFTFKRGNKKVGTWKTKYPDIVPGYIGFHAPGLESIELSCELQEEAWVVKQEELEKALRDRFQRDEYDPLGDMPEWFRTSLETSKLAVPFRQPDGVSQEEWDALAAAEWASAEWLKETNLQGGEREYALAYAHYLRGDARKTLPATKAALDAGFDFGPVHALGAWARFISGGKTGALADLTAQLEAWPDDCGAMLVKLAGRRAGPREALKQVETALASGALSDNILALRKSLQEVLVGPAGPASERYSGQLATVLSDATPDAATAVGEWAESFHRYLSRSFLEIQRPKGPLHILHFSDEASLSLFLRRAGLDPSLRGHLPDQHTLLVVWDAESEDPPEGFYGDLFRLYAHTSLGNWGGPRWLVHGLVQWFNGGKMEGEVFRSHPNRDALARCAENEDGLFFRPHQLARLPAQVWEQDENAAYWAYCESYLLVHFLFSNDTGPYAGSFRRFLGGAAIGMSANEAWNAAFSKVDLDEFFAQLSDFRLSEIG
ncbi:MAG: hypothetical protein MK213_02145 [Planctomycetes bacterium]|nr:hypothetical protein [Planctomycetota bacterium]